MGGGADMLDQLETIEPGTASCASPAKALDVTPTELPPISCSHCQQTMPNAMELVTHLQHCEPALDVATDEEQYRGKDLSYCGVETAPGYGEVSCNSQTH